MSAETLQAVEDAIRAHLAATDDGSQAVLGDWFVGYASMHAFPESPDGICHHTDYVTSATSPHGVYGVGKIALGRFRNDIDGGDEDDE